MFYFRMNKVREKIIYLRNLREVIMSINHLRRDTYYITVKVRRVYRLTLGTDVHNIYATILSSLDTECRADYQV